MATFEIDIADAIIALNPTAQVNVNGEKIEWVDGNPTNITKKQIDEKIIELKINYNNKQYQRDRKKEYPSIEDQLDNIYHNGINAWRETIKITKERHPK
jgi:hypothetical protein|tara:strand:- start:1430 stop:1726 length:297 start_codon:yes stop_codon:yes gene_type:complete